MENTNDVCRTALRFGFVIAKLDIVDGYYLDKEECEEGEPTIEGPSNGFTFLRHIEEYWWTKTESK